MTYIVKSIEHTNCGITNTRILAHVKNYDNACKYIEYLRQTYKNQSKEYSIDYVRNDEDIEKLLADALNTNN